MNYPIMVVTALGRETFSLSQARSLDDIGGVSYIRAPNPIPLFIKTEEGRNTKHPEGHRF